MQFFYSIMTYALRIVTFSLVIVIFKLLTADSILYVLKTL